MLEVIGSNFETMAGQERFFCPNMLSLVSCAGMTLNKCAVLWIATLTVGPLCRESRPLCRLKNPTVVYMVTCRLSSCKTGDYTVHLLIILERWCSSTCIECKKERKGEEKAHGTAGTRTQDLSHTVGAL